MQITNIVLGVTAKIDDDYRKCHLEAEIFPTDDFQVVVDDLRDKILTTIGLKTEPLPEVTKKEQPKETPKKEEPVKAEEPKKKAPAKKKATAKKAAPKKSKATVYNREIETHKTQLSLILDEKFPGWKKKPEMTKAAAALSNKTLAGVPFIGEDGEVLQSFIEAVETGINGAL